VISEKDGRSGQPAWEACEAFHRGRGQYGGLEQMAVRRIPLSKCEEYSGVGAQEQAEIDLCDC